MRATVFRFAIRRVLWALPTLFGVSLVVFLSTSLLPRPSESLVSNDPLAASRAERERFLDLPRFFNAHPEGVGERATRAARHVIDADAEAALATRELTEMGGAALPTLLRLLDTLAGVEQQRLALALAPIGRRIGRADSATLEDPVRAVRYWTDFWHDYDLEFSDAIVKRKVQRLVDYGGEDRLRDLRMIDTFALPELVAAMRTTHDHRALRELSLAASHATGRALEIPVEASESERRTTVAAWQSYWFVNANLYRSLNGSRRVFSVLTESRYAKWMGGALSGRLPTYSAADRAERHGRTTTEQLVQTLPVTLSLVLLAVLLSFVGAIPLGMIGAYRRGEPVDVVLAMVLLALHSLPAFAYAELFATWLPETAIVLPALSLALGALGTLSRYQRAALLEVLGSEYVRAARAKGAGGPRLMVFHALRTAAIPMVALSGLQVPTLFGGALLVEEIFAVDGLGRALLVAIRSGDVGFVVVSVLAIAVVASLCLVMSDLVAGVLDPRVRETLRLRGAR